MANLPAYQAAEDLRMVMAAGAVFGGKEAKNYVDHLIDTAFDDEPQTARIVKHQFAAADAKRGVIQDAPREPNA